MGRHRREWVGAGIGWCWWGIELGWIGSSSGAGSADYIVTPIVLSPRPDLRVKAKTLCVTRVRGAFSTQTWLPTGFISGSWLRVGGRGDSFVVKGTARTGGRPRDRVVLLGAYQDLSRSSARGGHEAGPKYAFCSRNMNLQVRRHVCKRTAIVRAKHHSLRDERDCGRRNAIC